MNTWKPGDIFRLSGIIDLGTHCPRVRTTGKIIELLHNKKATVILDKVEDEANVNAIIKLRDIKPPITKNK